MKKSELFSTIFKSIYKTNSTLFDDFLTNTLIPELNDELLDLNVPEEIMGIIKRTLELYSQYSTEVLSASITQILSDIVNVENDIDLNNSDTIFRLTTDTQTLIE